jgi:hypothetical protein
MNVTICFGDDDIAEAALVKGWLQKQLQEKYSDIIGVRKFEEHFG